MNFADSRFWVLFVCGLAVILVLRAVIQGWFGTRLVLYDKAALSGLGLFMLLSVSGATFLIFVGVALLSYAGMGWLVRHQEKRWPIYLALLLPLQLLPLLYFKYADFALNRVLGFNLPALRDLVIPAGISFYTFQMMSFVLDTLAFKKPLPRLLDFLNFAGFFPQVVAGPIERRAELLPQMEQFRWRWQPEDINEGATWIALGLFFKCGLADNLAVYFDGSSATNPFLVWLANVLFGLRIYYDFAGYSLIAVGLGRCLGVKLTLNFLSPYCATSAIEFWRRWHITLSQWFRDYVYAPLGGARTERWVFNVAVVFIVSGVWHGAGWNFMLWGVLHGAYLIVNRLAGRRFTLPRFPAWVLTVAATFFAWLCFYERDTGALFKKMHMLCTPAAYSAVAAREAMTHLTPGNRLVLACFLLLAAGTLLLEWLSVARRNEPYYFLRRPAVVTTLVLLTVLLAPGKYNAFIYFAF